MTRWLLIALAVSACAKGKDKDSAPATAYESAPTPPVGTPPPVPTDPETARRQALEEARNHASLGVSANTDSFDEGEGGSDTTKGTKPKQSTDRSRDGGVAESKPAPGSDGEPPKVGSTRGDAKKRTYRAQIVAVKLEGMPAPAVLVSAIKANATKVQACYDKTLAAWPELVGQLAVTFTVLPTGALTAGAVGTSTVKQDALETCVITALQSAKLATPLGKTEMKAEVTITFKAK